MSSILFVRRGNPLQRCCAAHRLSIQGNPEKTDSERFFMHGSVGLNREAHTI